MRRKICVVTGTRAEYGIFKALMRAISNSPLLELQILVTGTHIIPEYGYTIQDIISDGFQVDEQVPMVVAGNSKQAMATSIGVGITAMTQSFTHLNPDIVVVLGDRYEILSAAIAAVYSGLVLAHLSGGDTLSGGYDEYTRHAVTKLSHIHFTFTQKCAERVIKMGEEPAKVFYVGSPALDTILNTRIADGEEIRRRYKIPEKSEYYLLVQHPLSTSPQDSRRDMNATLEALDSISNPIVIIHPNADPGSYEILRMIQKYAASHENVITFQNVPFEDYLALMRSASVMIGNSSSAILEAPSFALPAINIGTRQEGREQGGNIINVPPQADFIRDAIQKIQRDQDFKNTVRQSKNPYGDGHASERIVRVLEDIVIDEKILAKQISY